MKRLLLLVSPLVVTLVFVLASCASTGGAQIPKDVPSWYLNPPTASDTLYGVGSAKLSTLDLSRTTAIARARDDIAREVQTSVKNALTDYAQQAGEGSNNQTIQFVEQISRQVADVTLQGTQTEKVAVGHDGTIYALVSYPKTSLLSAASNQFQRNQASAFAEFKATEALKSLNTELKNNPPKAGTPASSGNGG